MSSVAKAQKDEDRVFRPTKRVRISDPVFGKTSDFWID